MGPKLSKKVDRIPPDEFEALIRHHLRYCKFWPGRYPYEAYSMVQLRSFLDETLPGLSSEGDPALQLMNLERRGRKRISTFGYVYGDLRLPEQANTVRLCSHNFYLDRSRTLWLIDPKTGRVFRPPGTVEAYMLIV